MILGGLPPPRPPTAPTRLKPLLPRGAGKPGCSGTFREKPGHQAPGGGVWGATATGASAAFPSPETTKVPEPYKFVRSGDMDVTKPFQFVGSGAMDASKPYNSMGLGDIHGPKPCHLLGL